jgi:hypothetical protein
MRSLVLTLSLITTTTSALAFFRPVPENERITALLEGRREITSLTEIKRLGLDKGMSKIDLWSGSYWPHFQGSLGVRYRDPNFSKLIEQKEQWDKFKELSEKLPLYSYAGKENLLSPAEKYDLLVGDTAMTLTKYSWELGEKAQKLGRVPTWRGICDGWASAAQMMPRPQRAVTLTSPRGTPLTFYPEDIKALGSLLYARAQDEVIFLGKRCYSAVLGVFTGACEGTNPAAFHKALVNRVGAMKKTFVADASTSSEVWNYPVKNYQFTYYNVFTEEEANSFEEALELFVKKNRFMRSGKRHERTHAIVGVKAEVTYTDMRPAHLLEMDGTAQDKEMKQTYYYDLELDRSYNVIGGEWIGSLSPDFIWAPNDDTYPLSEAEESGRPRNAAEIVKAAQASSKVGQPLSIIVEKLFELSR